jgi:hypothetical protein
MDVTNVSSDTYVFVGGRTLSPGSTLHINDPEYGDIRLRSEINALYSNGKISVANAPSGFPNYGTTLNCCVIGTDNPTVASLTPASDFARIQTLNILEQTGSDFYIGEYPSSGRPAVFSKSGGVFQFGVFMQQPGSLTLSGTSNEPRILYAAASVGVSGKMINQFGTDIALPLIRGSWGYSTLNSGVPGIVNPNGPCFHGLILQLHNYVTGDTVALTEWDQNAASVAIWQLA